MKTLNNKSLKVILATLSLLVFAMFVFIYIVYADIKSKNERISLLSNSSTFSNSRLDYLISTGRIIRDLDADIERINNSIVAKDGAVKFIESLESIARDRGLSIVIDSLTLKDSPESGSGSSSVAILEIRAKTQGGWASTYRFLAELESLPFKIRVNQFSLVNTMAESDTKKADDTDGKWQSAFEINVLEYK